MKIKLSQSILRKILIGTIVFNSILLVTYVFLLISATLIENYTIFLLSIPAYIFSKSWLLILGLFGFEVCLIVYYWYKSKNRTSLESNSDNEQSIDILFDEELIQEEPIEQFNDIIDVESSSLEEITEYSNLSSEIEIPQYDNQIIETNEENSILIKAEEEFDQLWKEAIDHVKKANNKKKAGESVDIIENDSKIKIEKESKKIKNSLRKFDLQNSSRAVISKSKIKQKKNLGNYSVIKNEHKEFYNELAINNWIYKNSLDRERVGLYKIALDETRFRENDILYLIENGIIFKIIIPFPSDPFIVYSIYESEDKKIICNYLAKFCKQNNLKFNQKSIAFVNYSELGLERKNWRFDFYINNSIVGLIWVSNFLIEDTLGNNFSIAYNNKKSLKALLAASQIHLSDKKLIGMIIIDYNFNARIVKSYIDQLGYGQLQILAIGEKNFENKLLKLSKTQISV
ncbi:MAG: hypothetical protein FK731_11570 [Asgard group archaeon]|nr:hypothetical protein [Asgard group archaeon]